MEPTPDDVAGVVDLFGALSPAAVERALAELAFKRGVDLEEPEAVVRRAERSYALVRYESDGQQLLAPGPTAFPRLPDGAEDLPHILDAPDRDPDRDALARAVARRYREEALLALTVGASEAREELVDVGYDVATWADVDVDAVHDRLLRAGD